MVEDGHDAAVVDFKEALENLEGDVELVRDVMEIFIDRGTDQLREIGRAIGEGDVETVMIQSHGMKGGASNFCGHRFCGAAYQLETLARAGALEGAEDLFLDMQRHFDELEETFTTVNWDALETEYETAR